MCRACLDFKDDKEQSGDYRYCNSCFDFLSEEANNYSSPRSWMPRTEPVKERAKKDTTINGKINRLQKVVAKTEKKKALETAQTATSGNRINRKHVTSHKPIKPTPLDISVTKPDEMLQRIMALKEAGHTTTRAIGKILGVSHMTVARKLAGQKELF
jgi:hypothetical protein